MRAAVPRGTGGPPERGPRAPLGLRQPGTLRVRVVTTPSGTLVQLSGPVDEAAIPALDAALAPCRQQTPGEGHRQPLVLDLRAIDYIESPGLRLLLTLSDELPASGQPVRLLIRPGSRVERTLKLAGLDQRLPLYATVAAAWAGEPTSASHPV